MTKTKLNQLLKLLIEYNKSIAVNHKQPLAAQVISLICEWIGEDIEYCDEIRIKGKR